MERQAPANCVRISGVATAVSNGGDCLSGGIVYRCGAERFEVDGAAETNLRCSAGVACGPSVISPCSVELLHEYADATPPDARIRTGARVPMLVREYPDRYDCNLI